MRCLVGVLVALQCTGCASMFHGTTDQISIESHEEDSTIYVDDQEVGTDSAIAIVPKKGDHIIRVSKEGCTDKTVPIRYSFDGVSLLGFLLDFGIFSMLIIDGAATGAITRADQTSYVLSPNCHHRRRH